MAFGGFSQDSRQAPMNEINMVPLIDVMLVLRIVFMITAPLLTHSIRIELPLAASETTNEDPDTVTLAMDGEGGLFWNNEPIDDGELLRRLALAGAAPVQPELHLRADRETRYQKLAEVMSAARSAGIRRMGFITTPD
jgi:biopolymer transport protein ExbD